MSLHPYSRPAALSKLDGRTKEARLVQQARGELLAHLGTEPSAVQRAIIEQCVQLRLRLATMDRRFAETGEMTEHDSRTYLAWSNSYSRLLCQLGIKSGAQRGPDFATRLAQKAAQKATGAEAAAA